LIIVTVPRLAMEHATCRDSRELALHKSKREVIMIHQEGTLLSAVRNKLIHSALSNPKTEWVFCWDSDMWFPPNIIDDMIDRAERNNIKAMTGVYFNKDMEGMIPLVAKYIGDVNGTPTFNNLIDPVWKFLQKYGQIEGVADEYAYLPAPDDEALIPVDAAGAGCLLIHREVLEAVGDPWFSFERGCSEDYFFCLRVKECGYQMYADLSVQCGHAVQSAVTHRTFLNLYPPMEVQFRQEIGNSHIATAEKYFNLTRDDIAARSRNVALTINDRWRDEGMAVLNSDDYIFDLMSWNISARFTNIFREIYDHINQPKGEAKALVFGGGIGTESVLLGQRGWKVTHFDISDTLLNYSKFYANYVSQVTGIPYNITFTSTLPPRDKYDLILAIDVLNFIEDAPATLRNLSNRLKQDGLMVIALTSPNRRQPFHYNHANTWLDTLSQAHLQQVTKFTYRKITP
jgi:2-polyprenyl-3-methyl-5-hydroxy-6-metoxy-1,4-benzoquinol methylase